MTDACLDFLESLTVRACNGRVRLTQRDIKLLNEFAVESSNRQRLAWLGLPVRPLEPPPMHPVELPANVTVLRQLYQPVRSHTARMETKRNGDIRRRAARQHIEQK